MQSGQQPVALFGEHFYRVLRSGRLIWRIWHRLTPVLSSKFDFLSIRRVEKPKFGREPDHSGHSGEDLGYYVM